MQKPSFGSSYRILRSGRRHRDGGDEGLVLEDILDERAPFLAPFRTGILGEDAATSVGELLEAVAHCSNLLAI
jgi:hypothetical protein